MFCSTGLVFGSLELAQKYINFKNKSKTVTTVNETVTIENSNAGDSINTNFDILTPKDRDNFLTDNIVGRHKIIIPNYSSNFEEQRSNISGIYVDCDPHLVNLQIKTTRECQDNIISLKRQLENFSLWNKVWKYKEINYLRVKLKEEEDKLASLVKKQTKL